MPNIGNHEAKIGPPVLITLVLLTIIPSSPGYIDCRISCRRCHENTEHPAVLEVYCAMCEECKQRRRERMQGRALQGKANPTSKPSAQPTLKPLAKLTKLKQLVRMRDGEEANANDEAMIIKPPDNVQFRHGEQDYPGQSQQQQPFVLQQLMNPPQRPPQRMQPQLSYKPQKVLRGVEYPEGCPTPPICSDSEDEEERLRLTDVPPFIYSDATTATATITTTTTTTTTTQQPCPPVTKCRKKKKTTGTCTNPCMFPPYMCPCPIYPPTHPYWPPPDPTNFPPMPPNFRPSDVPPMPIPYPPHPYPPNPYPPPMYPPPPPVLVPMPPPPWPGWFPPMYPPTHTEKGSSTVSTLEFEREDTKTKTSSISIIPTTIHTTEPNEGYFYLHVGLPVQNNT